MNPDPQRSPGPVAWVAIVAVTLAMLLALRSTLWLVVPALLAMLVYYALHPLVHALVHRGVERSRASAAVMFAFMTLLGAAAVLVAPRAASHALGWQASVARYLEGGLHLLDTALRALESAFPALARAGLSGAVNRRLEQAADLAGQLEPLVLGVAAATPSLLLAPFLAYFFLRDGRRFKELLCSAVPNAFFERSLGLLHQIDRTARAYFQGLLKLTVLDTLTLAAGLWVVGLPGALLLGLVCAVLAWIPYLGSVLGGLLVVLVAATDFPASPMMAFWAAALFVLVRLLDDFVYLPVTIGRDLRMHPLVAVVMIFAGGAVAGIAGLMLVLPVLGVMRVIGETLGGVVTDARLRARHRHALRLRRRAAASDLARRASEGISGTPTQWTD
jgi:predicted PurR-regulated permease PerM